MAGARELQRQGGPCFRSSFGVLRVCEKVSWGLGRMEFIQTISAIWRGSFLKSRRRGRVFEPKAKSLGGKPRNDASLHHPGPKKRQTVNSHRCGRAEGRAIPAEFTFFNQRLKFSTPHAMPARSGVLYFLGKILPGEQGPTGVARLVLRERHLPREVGCKWRRRS